MKSEILDINTGNSLGKVRAKIPTGISELIWNGTMYEVDHFGYDLDNDLILVYIDFDDPVN